MKVKSGSSRTRVRGDRFFVFLPVERGLAPAGYVCEHSKLHFSAQALTRLVALLPLTAKVQRKSPSRGEEGMLTPYGSATSLLSS